MRILIISPFFPPLNSIASLRPYSWAKFWSLEGHEVTVLTTAKEPHQTLDLKLENPGFEVVEIPFPSWILAFKGKQRQGGREEGEPHVFDRIRRKTGIFRACRMPDFTDFWIRPASRFLATQGNWDLVVSTSGPYATHFIARKLKREGKARRWIADFRDRWSDNHIFPGLFPFNWMEAFAERWVVKQADLITTVSVPYAETFIQKYGKERVEVIENGFDPEDLLNLSKESVFPQDGKFRIVHTGTFFRRQYNPSPLFEAIRNLEKEIDLSDKLEVVFVGSEQQSLREMVKEHQVEKYVKIAGFVEREVALKMQQEAHALLFFPWNDPTVDGILSGKIFEYLFSGTPVIAVGGKYQEAAQNLIKRSKAGKILQTTESCKDFLREKLTFIKKEKSGVNGDILDKFHRKHLALKMLEFIS